MPAAIKQQISESQKDRWRQKPELHAIVSSKLKVSANSDTPPSHTNMHRTFAAAKELHVLLRLAYRHHCKSTLPDLLHSLLLERGIHEPDLL